MTATLRRSLVALALAGAACTAALREPPPLAGGREAGDVAAAMREAEAELARRPDAAAVERSRSLFLAAASFDESRVDGLLGALRALAWLVEHEGSSARRQELAMEAVQLGQWCRRRAPDSAECAYRLALAVGQQARERPATAADGLKVMVALLEEVASREPGLDGAGPERVLALVLLRAPGWPAGPGDPEAGLDAARRAVDRAPEYPPNLLALGEGLRANGHAAESRAACERARELASRLAVAGDPEAAEWLAEAERALRGSSH